MDVSIASDSDQCIWDNIVFSSKEGTLFHSWKWLKIMEKFNKKVVFSRTYKGVLYPLTVWDGDELVGIFPIFFYHTPFFNMACSPPFSVENYYLGPVIKHDSQMKEHRRYMRFFEFQKAVDGFLKNTLKPSYISVHTSPGFLDPRPYIWSGYEVRPEFTNIINLLQGEKTVWGNFNQGVKKSVTKLEKGGITIDDGTKGDLEVVFGLLSQRDRIHTSKEFLFEIYDNFSPENVRFITAKKDGVTVTGLLAMVYKKNVSIWTGSPRITIGGISPNYILYWELIKWACERAFSTFEIIGGNDLTLFPFKTKFGGRITPYYSMKWYSPRMKLVTMMYHTLRPQA